MQETTSRTLWGGHAEALADVFLPFFRSDAYVTLGPTGHTYTNGDPLTRETLAQHFHGLVAVGFLSSGQCLACSTYVLATAMAACDELRRMGLTPLIFEEKDRCVVRVFFRGPVSPGRLKVAGAEMTQESPCWIRPPRKRGQGRICDPAAGDSWLKGDASVKRLLRLVGDDPTLVVVVPVAHVVSVPVSSPGRLAKGSEQQEAIWSHILDAEGDMIVSARAGTGKSTTGREGMWRTLDREPYARSLYLAFNKSVAADFQALSPPRATVSTLNALGYQVMRDSWRSDFDMQKSNKLLMDIPLPPGDRAQTGFVDEGPGGPPRGRDY